MAAAGGPEAAIALLMQDAQGWGKHKDEYLRSFVLRGATNLFAITPDGRGLLDVDEALAKLHPASGIFIGGGHTPTYHRLYATEPIRSAIRERYYSGIPVAGLSAGAIITTQVCVLDPERSNEAPQVVDGLGLLKGAVVEAHFAERNALPDLVSAMATTRTSIGWGIDESACAVFEDEAYCGAIGESVYKITTECFDSLTYEVVDCSTSYPGQV
jgi:cyanophycinase